MIKKNMSPMIMMISINNGRPDIEILLGQISEEDYYKPIFVKSSFDGNHKYYESIGDKEKRLSVSNILTRLHCIYMI